MPSTDPPATVPNGMATVNAFLDVRDSFFWDRRAFAAGGGDFTKARIYHFLHELSSSMASRVLASIKPPLESRIWYNYPGQPNADYEGTSSRPSVVGRVLDDGTTQL